MNRKDKLAIVIPAYKAAFLREAIQSIAQQTCKDFTLYIGDDASPHDLSRIIADFDNKMNIVYKRFDENLGGKDLAGHWNRCVGLVKEESWIWLFSDDDIMEPGCVEAFYVFIQAKPDVDLVHFNVQVISNKGSVIRNCPPFPALLSAEDFFAKKVTCRLESFAVEYIFKRSVYEANGKFESFDLAWGSDDATWIKFSKKKGIRTINGPVVKWRYSQENITAIAEDKNVIIRKLNAVTAYLKWANHFFTTHHLKDATSSFDKVKFLVYVLIHTSCISFQKKCKLLRKSVRELGFSGVWTLGALYLMYGEAKRRL
ncbi:MAG: glycosyltransferase family 2 protein [Flavisolibacter sp.]|nr:glycosyltransferase family 2 protein [Flavisolibacter sp.]MBD0376251.1 glycosyltransferase family 2 protein [Flavisolibacter sp.]